MNVCIEQIDLENGTIGGISSFMETLISYSPTMQFTIVGMTKDRFRRLGEIRQLDFEQKKVNFLPIGRFPKAGKGRFPIFIRLAFGVIRYRSSIPAGTRIVHHVETGFFSMISSREELTIFLHNSRASLTGQFSDSFWKYFPKTYGCVEKFVLRRANSVVVLAGVDFPRIAKLSRKVYLSSTWFESKIFNSDNRRVSSSDKFQYVWVGRLESQKNPMAIFPIAQALLESGVSFRIDVFGSGSLESRMSQEIAKLNMSEFIKLNGFLGKKDLAHVFMSSDALFMTSHYEGSSIVLKEALGAGLPVIVNPESDPDGIVHSKSNGFVVESLLPKSYAQALRNCRDINFKNCSKSVSRFKPEIVIPRIIEIIQQ